MVHLKLTAGPALKEQSKLNLLMSVVVQKVDHILKMENALPSAAKECTVITINFATKNLVLI